MKKWKFEFGKTKRPGDWGFAIFVSNDLVGIAFLFWALSWEKVRNESSN